MQFFSHKNPDKLLQVHLKEVFELACQAQVSLKSFEKDALKVMCLCHDFGKFTSYFQEHLGGRSNKYSNHGFISSIFAVFCWISKKKIDLNKKDLKLSAEEVISLLIYSCILHHHGDVKDVSKNLPKAFGREFKADVNLVRKIDEALVQIDDMKKNKNEIKSCISDIGLSDEFEEFLSKASDRKFIEDLLKGLKMIEYKLRSLKATVIYGFDNKFEIYFTQQKLYSLLIWADKMSAGNFDVVKPLYSTYKKLILAREKVIKPSAEQTIQKIRQNVFESVIKNIEKNKEKDVFSITTPTGTGKTLAGVFAALKLREIANKKGRIIYCLPFTSIIDQNYEIVKNLFETVDDFEQNKDRYLLKHHHLTDVNFIGKKVLNMQTQDEEITVYDKVASECFIENWTSGFVVTTFVQLLETLISNKNRMLKKFHVFYDSVLILDEIQAVEVELLPLVEEMLNYLIQFFKCKIILMTATKPLIFDNACELAEGCDYSMFDRTKIVFLPEQFTVSEFVEFFTNNIYCEEKSFLIVTNTINQSLQVFNGIKNNLSSEKVIYLSANLIPVDRKNTIKKIEKMLESGENPVVVSTQVIEAGVDLDFDCVIRDIAPIDSIIQCAGRCNRHAGKEKGDVLVVNMKDEKGVLFSKRVYGNTAIEISKNVLFKYQSIDEKDYGMIIEEYFRQVKENKSFEKSKEFLKSIENLKFDCMIEKEELAISRFSLISQRAGYVSIIVRCNQEIEEAYQKYLQSFSIKEYYKRREVYLEIKNKLFEYTISIPTKYADVLEENRGILSLPPTSCERYYNSSTGFVYEQGDFVIYA